MGKGVMRLSWPIGHVCKMRCGGTREGSAGRLGMARVQSGTRGRTASGPDTFLSPNTFRLPPAPHAPLTRPAPSPAWELFCSCPVRTLLHAAGAVGQILGYRHSAGVVAGLLTTTTSLGGGSGSRGSRRHVVQSVQLYSRWWLRLNLRGRLEAAFPVVAPITTRRTAWDIGIMVLVLYSAVTVPLAFSYGMPSNTALTALEWGLTVLYTMDICLCFRTGFCNADGNLVRECVFTTITGVRVLPTNVYLRVF